MKKLILLATIIVAFSANAKLTIEQKWQNTNLPAVTNDNRQGVGINGKFYIQDKASKAVYVFDENGMTGDQFASGGNCGIALDDAGNLVVSCAAFSGSWGADAGIKVINPNTGETKYYEVPTGAVLGRCDFLGHAKGNLFYDGELYLVGANQIGVYRLVISDGEVSEDDSYEALMENGSASSSTVVNAFTNAAGDDALLYVYRSGAPRLCEFEGDNLVSDALTLPNKGACNGAQAFVLGGKNYVVYPTLPNYQDGFAVAEMGAEEAEFQIMPTGIQANGIQCNWLNVEVVDENTAMLYQYQPGGHMTVYEIKVAAPAYSLVGNINGADYGCEADFENPGEYIFDENGKLKVTFTQPSYVFVKTTDNSKWFLSPQYVPFNAEYIHGDFYNGAGYGEKMQVPAGEVDFRLTVVDENHLYLSATSDYEETYYMKHPWGGGEWTWKEMTKVENTQGVKLAEEDEVYYVDAEYGENGVNVNIMASDDGAQWFATPNVQEGLEAGTMCRFTYYKSNNYVSITAIPITGINDLNVNSIKAYKTIENGQVVIVKGAAKYNVAGQAIK